MTKVLLFTGVVFGIIAVLTMVETALISKEDDIVKVSVSRTPLKRMLDRTGASIDPDIPIATRQKVVDPGWRIAEINCRLVNIPDTAVLVTKWERTKLEAFTSAVHRHDKEILSQKEALTTIRRFNGRRPPRK